MNSVNIPNHHDDPVAAIFLRNEFYKKKFHTILGIFFLSVLGIVVLLGVLIYLAKHPPEPVYFVADPVSRLIQDIPVSQPNMSLDDVTAWAIEAVQKAYSYDYMNYRGELQDAQKYFAAYGWRNYMQGLKASNNLLALAQRKLVIVVNVVEKPQLVNQGLLGGAYAYKFRMPVLAMYWEPPYDDHSKFYNPLINTVKPPPTKQSLQ